MDVALTGAPLTQAEQQRPTEVPENLPAMQSPIRGWEGQENVIDNGSTAYCGVATLSPTDTSGTVRSSVSPNIFDLAVNRYVFDHPVFLAMLGILSTHLLRLLKETALYSVSKISLDFTNT